jgi:hypothetical protein
MDRLPVQISGGTRLWLDFPFLSVTGPSQRGRRVSQTRTLPVYPPRPIFFLTSPHILPPPSHTQS